MSYYKSEHASQVCIFHQCDVFHTIFETKTFSSQESTLPATFGVDTARVSDWPTAIRSLLSLAGQSFQGQI